jgi:hypothetical protein
MQGVFGLEKTSGGCERIEVNPPTPRIPTWWYDLRFSGTVCTSRSPIHGPHCQTWTSTSAVTQGLFERLAHTRLCYTDNDGYGLQLPGRHRIAPHRLNLALIASAR